MSLYNILRVLVGVVISGVIGWLSLFAFNAVKIWQQFEAFEAAGSRADFAAHPGYNGKSNQHHAGRVCGFSRGRHRRGAARRGFQNAFAAFLCRRDRGADGGLCCGILAGGWTIGHRSGRRGAGHGRICRRWHLLDDCQPHRIAGLKRHCGNCGIIILVPHFGFNLMLQRN